MYRNNILLTFSDYGNNSEIGIYKKKKSRELIPVEDIHFSSPNSRIIGRDILNFLESNNIASIYNYKSNNGCFNHMAIRQNLNNQYLIEFYLREDNNMILNKLNKFNWDHYNIKSVYYQLECEKTNDFRKDYKKLYGDDYLTYNINNYKLNIMAGSFFQTNNEVLVPMYNNIINLLDKNIEYNFLDLYCGVGVMSILVNRFFGKCIGVEINPNAIKVANYNKEVNNCDNCLFACSPVEELLDIIDANNMVIFVNPPRRGMYSSVIHKINSMKSRIKQIVYLSCSEKSLMRDLKLFNFESQIVKKYNMFPDTDHYEYLVKLV